MDRSKRCDAVNVSLVLKGNAHVGEIWAIDLPMMSLFFISAMCATAFLTRSHTQLRCLRLWNNGGDWKDDDASSLPNAYLHIKVDASPATPTNQPIRMSILFAYGFNMAHYT